MLFGPQKPPFGLVCTVAGKTWLAYSHHWALIHTHVLFHVFFRGIFALRAHYALLLDYVPPEEPLGTPLGNALRIK